MPTARQSRHFLHSYRNSAHEDAVAAVFEEAGLQVSSSHRWSTTIVNLRVTATGVTRKPELPRTEVSAQIGAVPSRIGPARFGGKTVDTGFYRWEDLAAGTVGHRRGGDVMSQRKTKVDPIEFGCAPPSPASPTASTNSKTTWATMGSTAARSRFAPAIRINGDRAEVDFTGTDPQTTGGVNASYAITLSATLYCFRCLIAEERPLQCGHRTRCPGHRPGRFHR